MANSDFPPTSRYRNLALTTLTLRPTAPSCRSLAAPLPAGAGGLTVLREHAVVEGERPDHVAARELGDRRGVLAPVRRQRRDAPDELTDEVGELVRITLPDGVPPPARGEPCCRAST